MAKEITPEIEVDIVTIFQARVGDVAERPMVLLTLSGKDALGAEVEIATVALDAETANMMAEDLKDAAFELRFGAIEALY